MAERAEYNEICPKCQAEGLTRPDGKPSTLGLNYSSGQIDCPNNHTFENLPSEKETTQQETVTQPPAGNYVVGKVEAGTFTRGQEFGIQPAMEPEAQAKAQERLSEINQQMNETASKMDAASGTVNIGLDVSSVTSSSSVVPVFEMSGVARSSQTVAEGQCVELPGGDILLGVRISEQWRQAVEAEAEAKGMKTADYFAQWLTSQEMQDAMSDLLSNYWVSNYAQAR